MTDLSTFKEVEAIARRWRDEQLSAAVMRRMVHWPFPVVNGKKVWVPRPKGLRWLRIFTGRLARSIKEGPENIFEVRIEGDEVVIEVGSKVPYARRHDERPTSWEPYFTPALAETVESLIKDIENAFR